MISPAALVVALKEVRLPLSRHASVVCCDVAGDAFVCLIGPTAIAKNTSTNSRGIRDSLLITVFLDLPFALRIPEGVSSQQTTCTDFPSSSIRCRRKCGVVGLSGLEGCTVHCTVVGMTEV